MRDMTDATAAATRAQGTLLLADISGYTGFLQGVADAHRALILEAPEPPQAYAFVSSLLDTMVSAITPTFRLVKLEGDALFAVAGDGELSVRGPSMLACLRGCYEAFRARLALASSEWTCECNACARIGELDLKFVLHHGEYVMQRVVGHDELLGPDVNLVHRLLKNHARDVIGARPYALFTEAAVRALEVPGDDMIAAVETYEDTPPIPVQVLALA